MLSVFTPTHNPAYLQDAYRSLQLQDYEDFEWVIVPNGDPLPSVPEAVRRDPRVRVVEASPADFGRVGALKRAACEACRGRVFIELDHDDLLTPGTLRKIADSYDAGAGFMFSDDAVIRQHDMSAFAYSPKAGWDSYDVSVYGRRLRATRAFEPSARSLCEVYYSPDHVRAWSRSAYFRAGGHDRGLEVGDDHDLMCRTYLAGEKFSHIGGCGYLYRAHSDNTVRKTSQTIQKEVANNRRKYLPRLIAEWCRRQGLASLSLRELTRTGWRCERDVASGLPCEPGSLGYVEIDDFLQYQAPGLVIDVMNAAFDALAPGGWVYVSVPTTEGGMAAYQHPQIQSFYNGNSFRYYTEDRYRKTCSRVRCKFQMVDRRNLYPTQQQKMDREMYFEAFLCAVKGQRHPGHPVV